MIGGLVDILYAGVVVATHAQRIRENYGGPAAEDPGADTPARDATAGVTVTWLPDAARGVSFADTPYAAGHRWACTAIDVSVVAGSVQCPRTGTSSASTPSATSAPANSVPSLTQRHSLPQELSRRKYRLATGTSTVAQVPELDKPPIFGF